MTTRGLLPIVLAAGLLSAQVTSDRLLHADREPQNWLTYGGSYASLRYSGLAQINRDNVKSLQLKWIYAPKYLDIMQATPLVVDGVLYIVKNNEVVAMDAATGRKFWTFYHTIPPESKTYVMVAKGLAISGDTLIWPTYEGHLIAIDAKTGISIWDRTLIDWHKGFQLNMAPIIVGDKIILGIDNNERGVDCWVGAYDIHTGQELWRFNTVAQPGEPGHETWGGDSWKLGGDPIWVSGSYDPETNLTYWGIGEPDPGWNGDSRPGDNLYSDSVVALDANSGKLKWYFQFTPHDEYDWDAVQVPVLTQIDWHGKPRKVMLWANRNGFFYVLDRVTGQFLMVKAFVKQNWNVGFDEKGRPMWNPAFAPKPMGGIYVEPGTFGGTNWYSPSYSPRTGLFYLSVWDNYGEISGKSDPGKWEENHRWAGDGRAGGRHGGGGRPVNMTFRTEAEGYGAIRALDPKTGEKKWDFKMVNWASSGVLSTASDLIFAGGDEGNFFALDARTGELLWKVNLGDQVRSGPISYSVDGRQYIGVGAGTAYYVFALQ